MASENPTASVKVGLASLRVYTVYLKRMISLFVFSPSTQIRIFINVLYCRVSDVLISQESQQSFVVI